MTIRELLKLIANIAKQKGTSEPFIVGGLPRDKVLGRLEEVQDIDLTTGDDSIDALASAVADYLSINYPDVHAKKFPDGHSQVKIGGMKIDFSSHFISPQAKQLVKKAGINATNMILELLSRDFTCNALIMSMDLKSIKDPTGMAINDIKEKIVRTPIAPKYTLSNDPKRIIRSVYLATKLGFDVEKPIIQFVSDNSSLVVELKDRFITDKINQSLDKDIDKTVRLLTDMNLWQHIPIGEKLAPYSVGKF